MHWQPHQKDGSGTQQSSTGMTEVQELSFDESDFQSQSNQGDGHMEGCLTNRATQEEETC
eukprot:1884782-Amphidinium_carterae.1